MIESGLAASLNHLLAREAWAREKLAPYAGEIVELRCAPLPPLRLAIDAGGLTARAEPGQPATLTLAARPELLGALLRGAGEGRGEEHLMRAVDVAGNARLASEILALLRYLRWDAEEDLSRVFGDVIAHRMVGAARGLAAWQRDAALRLGDSLAAWAVEERRFLVARPEFDGFAREVAALRDDLARLEQRLARLPG